MTSMTKVFVAVPFAISDVREVVINTVQRSAGFVVLDWAEQHRPGISLVEGVRDQIKGSDLLIVDVSTANANVTLEAGAAFALGIPVVVIERLGRPTPHHFANFTRIDYENLPDLEVKLQRLLTRFSEISNALVASQPRGPKLRLPRKLRLGDMPGEPATRVFVGGNYKDQFAILLEIRNAVNTLQPWVAIFANDFEMEKDRTRQESLRLLHMCDYAIFDVTSDGGQLVEIENAQQYGSDFLLLYNTMDVSAPPKVSSMLPRGSDAVPYTDLAGLKELIAEWLGSNLR